METRRVYGASNADWQNRMRIASYVGTMAGDDDNVSLMDVAIKTAFCLALLAIVLGALA